MVLSARCGTAEPNGGKFAVRFAMAICRSFSSARLDYQKDQKAKAPCSLCSLYNVDVCCLQARVKTDGYSVLILHMHLCAAVALCQQCSPIHKADHQQSHSDQISFVL